jgi:hypothetical protein
MNCKNWEERIALYSGGDPGPTSGADIERHLVECAGCRTFANGIKHGLELLRSAHREPIAAAHFTAVRAGVLARLAQENEQRRPWRWWLWVPGLTAALAVVAVFLLVRPAETPRVRVAAAVRPSEDAPVPLRPSESVVPRVRVTRVRPHRTVAPVPRMPGPPPLVEPLVVKLITSDPDIVIYWIADRKGEDE